MAKVSTNLDLIDIIVSRAMSILDKNPHIVGDVYKQEAGVSLYVKKNYDEMLVSYDFAVPPKRGVITHFITISETVTGISVAVRKISNDTVVFKVLLHENEEKFDMLYALYNRLDKYYHNDIEKTAMDAINSAFGD